MHFLELTCHKIVFFILIRWNSDPKHDGVFPIKFATIEKTLTNLKREKYDSSPSSIEEIQKAFDNPDILNDLGRSKDRENGILYKYAHEEKNFSYCVLQSPKSIQLILDNLKLPNERFFLIDGTFQITPMSSVFKQVLIIHAQFGIKVYLN